MGTRSSTGGVGGGLVFLGGVSHSLSLCAAAPSRRVDMPAPLAEMRWGAGLAIATSAPRQRRIAPSPATHTAWRNNLHT
jgi:hypothetical protein